MDQPTPKYDQLKRRFLQQIGENSPTEEGLRGSLKSDNDGLEFDLDSATLYEINGNLKFSSTARGDPAGSFRPENGTSTLNNNAKVRSKIAALLRRSVQDSRKCLPSFAQDTEVPIWSDLKESLNRLYNSVSRGFTSASSKQQQNPLDFSKINKNIQIAVNTGDENEILGWFQQKVKHLEQEFLLLDEPGSLPGRRWATQLDRSPSTNSEFSGTSPQVLEVWEDLQLYLDALKSSIKKMRGGNSGSTSSTKDRVPTSNGQCVELVNALHETALLLAAGKVVEKSEYIQRLHTTVQEQTDLMERMEERLVELREKVREYGRDNADLEARTEELKVNLRDALSQRYEADERVELCERRSIQLQEDNLRLTAEIAQLRSNARAIQSQHALSTHSLHASSADTHSAIRPSLNRLQAFERRIDNHVRGILSDTDSDSSLEHEIERKFKAQHAIGNSSPQSVRDHTTMTNRTGRGASFCEASASSAGGRLRSARRRISHLDSVRARDWVLMFNQRTTTMEEMHAAESDMNQVESDLESILGKFKSALREVKTSFVTRAAELTRLDRETAERYRSTVSENALCCICLQEAKTILLMPCRHLCVCQVCSRGPPSPSSPRSPRNSPRSSSVKMIQSCPVCRAAVSECLQVFA